MLTERIIETLESMDISVSSIDEQGEEFYCELEFYSPAGEDFIFTVWFDGTPEDFAEQFAANAEEFDPDEHAAEWVGGRGTRGIPANVRELIDDAEAIKEILMETAERLKNPESENEPLASSGTPKVTIIVKDGRVESVYSTEKNIDVEIIDLDTEDNEEYDNLMESVREAQENQYFIY